MVFRVLTTSRFSPRRRITKSRLNQPTRPPTLADAMLPKILSASSVRPAASAMPPAFVATSPEVMNRLASEINPISITDVKMIQNNDRIAVLANATGPWVSSLSSS